MSKSSTAALLSALVFPGSGHFFLKKYVQGTIFAGVASVCFFFLLLRTVEIAHKISDKILSGEIPIDVAKISEVILSELANSVIHQVNITTSLLFICWLVSIIDSYRLGRSESKNSGQ